MPEQPQQDASVVSRDNLGELLLLNYADFLRRTDEATVAVTADLTTILNGSKSDRGFLEKALDYAEFTPNQLASWLAPRRIDHADTDRITALLAKRVVSKTVGFAHSDYVCDKKGHAEVIWPLNWAVSVEAVNEGQRTIRKLDKQNVPKRREFTAVKGRLVYVDLADGPKNHGLLWVRRGYETDFLAEPLIDEHYNATVRLKFT